MNVSELFDRVSRNGGDVRAIFTGSGNPEDRYAIIHEGSRWIVFYTERGKKFEKKEFIIESEACEYIFSLLEKDHTIWINK